MMFRTLFILSWMMFHPVHVTLTSVDYNPESNSYNVFVRLYFDDFLLDGKLTGLHFENKDFSTDNYDLKMSLQEYFNERISIRVNDESLSGKLLDYKLIDKELSVNMEYASGRKPRKLTVKNMIMTGLYSDQSNMLIVKVNDFEKGVKLTTDMPEQTFKIK